MFPGLSDIWHRALLTLHPSPISNEVVPHLGQDADTAAGDEDEDEDVDAADDDYDYGTDVNEGIPLLVDPASSSSSEEEEDGGGFSQTEEVRIGLRGLLLNKV